MACKPQAPPAPLQPLNVTASRPTTQCCIQGPARHSLILSTRQVIFQHPGSGGKRLDQKTSFCTCYIRIMLDFRMPSYLDLGSENVTSRCGSALHCIEIWWLRRRRFASHKLRRPASTSPTSAAPHRRSVHFTLPLADGALARAASYLFRQPEHGSTVESARLSNLLLDQFVMWRDAPSSR